MLKLGMYVGLTALAVSAIWWLMPKGLQVQSADVRIQAVEQGTFLDEIAVRANAQPLNSVILDSVESGRVEEVFVQDGAMVKRGGFYSVYRTHNATSTSCNVKVSIRNKSQTWPIYESGFKLPRRIINVDSPPWNSNGQLKRDTSATSVWPNKGFISQAALEESQDALDRQQFAVDEEKQAQSNEGRKCVRSLWNKWKLASMDCKLV